MWKQAYFWNMKTCFAQTRKSYDFSDSLNDNIINKMRKKNCAK